MITDLRKSVNSILYDRVVSPLSGTFILSWCVINWRILYLIFFSDEEMGLLDKIDYIEENYSNWKELILYPLLSAIGLITIFPIFSIGAFWISRWFYNKQRTFKNKLDGQVMLTLEQSNALILKVQEVDKRYQEIVAQLSAKDDEIIKLKGRFHPLHKKDNNSNRGIEQSASSNNSQSLEQEYELLKNNRNLFEAFEEIIQRLQYNKRIGDMDKNIVDYFILNGIVTEVKLGLGDYELSAKGLFFKKLYINNKLIPK